MFRRNFFKVRKSLRNFAWRNENFDHLTFWIIATVGFPSIISHNDYLFGGEAFLLAESFIDSRKSWVNIVASGHFRNVCEISAYAS